MVQEYLINIIKNIFPKSKLGWLSLVLFLALSIPLTIYGQNERSGFTLMTSPIDISHTTNTLLGYSATIGELPIFRENIPFIQQVMLLSGVNGFNSQDVYIIRPFYAFLATLITPIIGIFNTFITINYLSWAIAAWVTWRFTKKLFQDELSSFISVIFVSGGLGFIAHIGDYSAHIIGFTSYYIGILILYESNVWFKSQSLRKHLLIGVCLAICTLTYTSSIALVVAYILVSLPFNKWYNVLVAAAIGLSSRLIWTSYLHNLGVTFPDIEGQYLDVAINRWLMTLLYKPLDFVWSIFKYFWEFISCFESPLILILGLISVIFFIFRKHIHNYNFYWFCLILFLMPIMGGIVYAPSAGARGYLIYGISLFVYCCLGGFIAKGIRNVGLIKITIIILFCFLISTQLIWSTVHFWGYLGAVKTFFLGYDNGFSVIMTGKPDILSLTGKEPTPVIFGEHSSLRDAGLLINNSFQSLESNQISFSMAVKSRSLFFCYFILIILFLDTKIKFKTKILVNIGLIIILFITSYLSIILVRNIPSFLNIDSAITLQETERIKYQIVLDKTLLNKINDKFNIGDELIIYIPILSSTITSTKDTLNVYINNKKITEHLELKTLGNKEINYAILLGTNNPQFFLSKFSGSLNLTIEIVANSSMTIKGWQKNNLPGRILEVDTITEREFDRLPAIELRLVNSDGVIKLAGF